MILTEQDHTNNVLPGFTNTGQADYVIKKRATATNNTKETVLAALVAEIPIGRIGEPSEFGAAVTVVASPAATYINGVNLPVNGGRLACL